MMYIDLISAALMGACLSPVAHAKPLLASNMIEGPTRNYTTTDIEWVIPIGDGRNFTASGTVEDVIRQLEIVAPEALKAGNVSTPGSEPDPASVSATSDAVLTKRDPLYPFNILCDNFGMVEKRHLKQGIEHLRRVNGMPKHGPGPDVCAQVSCSWKAAIWWCNDNVYSLTLDSFAMIADGAEAVLKRCRKNWFKVSGQAYFSDGWTVMVREENC